MSESIEHEQHAGDVFGLDEVRELLRLIDETDITEIAIERGDAKLHIKRGIAPAAPQYLMTPALAATLPGSPPQPAFGNAPPAGMAMPHASPAEAEAEALPDGVIIPSPMVGTFYAAASPKDPPYINEGDEVKPGDVVGIVEAMKIMNDIESDIAGRVVRVLVTSGQPVEYGQPLLIVEPG